MAAEQATVPQEQISVLRKIIDKAARRDARFDWDAELRREFRHEVETKGLELVTPPILVWTEITDEFLATYLGEDRVQDSSLIWTKGDWLVQVQARTKPKVGVS